MNSFNYNEEVIVGTQNILVSVMSHLFDIFLHSNMLRKFKHI